MKLIRELVFPTFLLLFIFLVVEEIAMFGISIIIYQDPIVNIREKIDVISFQANSDSTLMLKRALVRKFNQIATDMIYVGKHMKHLLSTTGPYVNQTSSYYASFDDNLCQITEQNGADVVVLPYYNSTSRTNNYIEAFSVATPRGTVEDDIINALFKVHALDQISKKTSLAGNNQFTEPPKVACYAISIFKSLFIKNFIIEHSAMTIRRFTLFIDRFAYVYPPETFSKVRLHKVIPNCNAPELLKDDWTCICNSINKDSVTFFKPKLDAGSIILSACLHIEPISPDVTPFVCADIILSNYLSNFIYNKDTIKQAFFNYDPNDTNQLKVFFTNEPALRGNLSSIFGSSAFKKYQLSYLSLESDKFSLFHLLYFAMFNKTLTMYLDITPPDIDTMIAEYEALEAKIVAEIQKIQLIFNKNPNQCDSANMYSLMRNFSISKSFISDQETQPVIAMDVFQFIVTPIVIDYPGIDPKTFLSTYPKCQSKILFYSITAVKYIPETRSSWLLDILFYKIIKMSLFYLSLIVTLVVSFYLLTQLYVMFLLRAISNIKEEIGDFNGIIKGEDSVEEKKVSAPVKLAVNKETSTLEDIFAMMKNLIIVKKTLSNLDFENKRESYEQLVNNINDRDVKEVCMQILGYSNFKQKKYSQAIYDFNYILEGLQLKEVRKLNSNEQLESQIKEILKRTADITYINYFTSFQGNNEAVLPLLKIRQLSQEIHYLTGLSLLQASQESKEAKRHHSLLLQDPLEYFIKARDINHNLEINLIKELFNMIMISRCYIKSGEYNKSMQNLNEALLLFNDLQKKINLSVNKDIDPKVLLFANNAIFHSIMLEIAITSYMNQMYYLAGWIVNKIFDTSIFLIDPVHLTASNLMVNILQKIIQSMDERKKTSSTFKEVDKRKALFEERLRFYRKISIRLQRKKDNKPNKKDKGKEKDSNEKDKAKRGNTSARHSLASNLPNSLNGPNKVVNEIILCISEKIFKMFNGPELKDIILKYISKNFTCEDTLSYIQFSQDGKRTFSIVREKLKDFIEKLKNEKTIFKQSEFITKQSSVSQKFTGFYAILETALNCIEFPKEGDNMIFMFINAKDIRFTSKKQCSDIVRMLNESNCSLILFSFEDELSEQKLEKLKSFLSCLVEGVFIQVKNYQVIKQVFQSLGSIQRYYNLNDFGFENIDYII